MAKGRFVPPAARQNSPPPTIPLTVELPPDVSWSAVGEALRRLEFYTESLKPTFLQECLNQARGIRFGERQGEFRFRVGEREVSGFSYAPPTVEPPTKLYELKCNRCTPSWACVHVAAVTLALGSRIPEVRALLTTPGWAMALAPLVEDGQRPKSALTLGDEPAAPGWVRYVLKPGEATDVLGGVRPTSAHLIRVLARPQRGTNDVTIGKFPASLDEAAARVDGVTEVDRRIDAVVEQIDLMEDLCKFNPQGLQRATPTLRSLETDWFALLPDAREVFVGETRVRVSTEPVTIRLEVEDGKEGSLRLRWVPQIKAIVPLGVGWLHLQDDTLRPLSTNTHSGVIRLIFQQTPKIPAEQIEDFLERFIPAVRVPLDLRTRHLRAAPAGLFSPRPRLIVGAVERLGGGGIDIDARFAYQVGDIVAEASAGDARPMLRLEGATGKYRVVTRDFGAEKRHTDALAAAGLNVNALDGDAALDFLLEGLERAQTAGFEVFLDASARKLSPRGALMPEVKVGSGLDWFDLKVSFAFDGLDFPLEAVLASWREGRKYHKLPDGQTFRLPEEWLAKHAGALVELQDVRAAAGNRMSAFAAPLVADLLEEAGAGKLAARWKEIARRILDFDGIPERPIPAALQAEPREYQKRGFHWLVWLRELNLGGVLADDMGLGKTLQTLMLLEDTHAEHTGAPSLVVAPTSVVFNWAAEAQKFTPHLRVYVHHGPNRRDKLPTDEFDIIVTSYALLRYDDKLFSAHKFRYVALDEAQQIKNPDSQIAQICQKLQSDHRLALSGTPMENSLVELWSLFNFLMPGFFGSRASFANRYANVIQRQQDQTLLDTLRKRIRPFILRRRKDEVATELPPRTEQVLYCELGPAQRKLYEAVKATFREQVMSKVESAGVGGATIQILEALMRLRQACCDPRLLPFEEARRLTVSAKRDLLRDTLEEIIAEGHRTLIFSQWPSLLRIVEEDLRAINADWLYLDGNTKDRKQLVDRWNRPDGPPVFLISLKAGGTGLNLTGADHVIHLDPWWNPAVERQATDRAHRIGQTKPVVVYKLVARDTVEEKILELQARKQALFDATVDSERLMLDDLTREELESVFAPAETSRRVSATSDRLARTDDAFVASEGVDTAFSADVLLTPIERKTDAGPRRDAPRGDSGGTPTDGPDRSRAPRRRRGRGGAGRGAGERPAPPEG